MFQLTGPAFLKRTPFWQVAVRQYKLLANENTPATKPRRAHSNSFFRRAP
jgi:hypothetical protein